jgi:hypothetical protein
MATFEKNFSYGLIKEVGEDDVLVLVDGMEIEIPLDDSTRKPIFDAVENGIYIVPVDVETSKLLITVDAQNYREIFLEADLKELKGAANKTVENE